MESSALSCREGVFAARSNTVRVRYMRESETSNAQSCASRARSFSNNGFIFKTGSTTLVAAPRTKTKRTDQF